MALRSMMMRRWFAGVLAGIVLALAGIGVWRATRASAPAPSPVATKKIDFNRDIRPILAEDCYFCHGADKVTLCRRVYFDLLGLPPTPQQVDAFVKDQRPGAYEHLVDALLASPHFGERMAVFWLDQVRYADTIGYHSDNPMNVWPYRDW